MACVGISCKAFENGCEQQVSKQLVCRQRWREMLTMTYQKCWGVSQAEREAVTTAQKQVAATQVLQVKCQQLLLDTNAQVRLRDSSMGGAQAASRTLEEHRKILLKQVLSIILSACVPRVPGVDAVMAEERSGLVHSVVMLTSDQDSTPKLMSNELGQSLTKGFGQVDSHVKRPCLPTTYFFAFQRCRVCSYCINVC